MKKLTIALLFLASTSKAQIIDTGSLRTYINTNIKPNAIGGITATKMNTLLNGMCNYLPYTISTFSAALGNTDSMYVGVLDGGVNKKIQNWQLSNSWKLTGNAGTVDGTNFIGTTDNIPLSIKVNNQLSGKIDGTNKITLLGYLSGKANAITNATAIGANAYAGSSNSLILGSINGVNGALADTKVGIGTTTPSERLHVVGNGLFTGILSTNTFQANGNSEFFGLVDVYGDMEANQKFSSVIETWLGNVKIEDAIEMVAVVATPTAPGDGSKCKVYLKDGKYVIQYNDSGTIRYKYLDLTGTGTTWVHTTVAP